jgi:hypothetical protein
MAKKTKMNNTIVTYNGIKFKSKLERACYQLLTEAGIKFKYENDIYTLVEKFSFPGSIESVKRKGRKVYIENPTVRAVKYTPDFTGTFSDGSKWIIETKGMKTTTFNLKWKLFKVLLLKQGNNVRLYMPTNKKEILYTIEQIKLHESLCKKEKGRRKSRRSIKAS